MIYSLFILAGLVGYMIAWIFFNLKSYDDFHDIRPAVDGIKMKGKTYICYICRTPIYEENIGVNKKGHFHFKCK